MNRAVYKFFDQQTTELAEVIEFDLVDNPGCKAWQFAVLLNSKSRHLKKFPLIKYARPPVNVDKIYDNLKVIISQINTTEFPVEFDVPPTFKYADQDLMNRLHRHFTNSCYTLWDLRYANVGPSQESVSLVLHELNEVIHRLENYLQTPYKIQLAKTYTQEEVHVQCDGNEFGYDIYPFRCYHSYDQADLILDSYILGKTLLESFACNDNPINWDTAGHMKTNGGAIITVGDVRQQIYNSPEFNNWLQEHNVNKHSMHADFPLGYFAPGHRSKFESLKKELWKYSSSIEILL
jgi:hypothetical protein